MPRPQKKRYVCREPDIRDFGPENPRGQISLSVDEYESIRLIDLENYTQEECAEQMCVSRTTVQGVYDAARKKIADALVNGKCLQIGGGDYVNITDRNAGAAAAVSVIEYKMQIIGKRRFV